jgi:hypothetical protein
MKKLLELGADLNAKVINCATPYLSARQSNKMQHIETLLNLVLLGTQKTIEDLPLCI